MIVDDPDAASEVSWCGICHCLWKVILIILAWKIFSLKIRVSMCHYSQKSDNVIPHSTPPSVPGKFASLIEACGLEARAIPS